MQGLFNAFNTPELRENSIPFVTAYDGDEGASDEAKPEQKAGAKMVQLPQEEFNAIIAERLSRQKASLTEEFKSKEAQALEQVEQLKNGVLAEKQQLISELEEFRGKFQGTEAEKQELQKRINTLKNEQLTAEEQAAHRIAELEERLSATSSTLTEQVALHKNTHANYRIEQELRLAAIANNALVPEQLLTLLKPQTVAVPVKDAEGNEIPGMIEVKTKINLPGKDGAMVEFELSPAEAVAKLKEDVDHWGNQFSSESKGGAGLNNQKGKAGPDGLVLDKDYAAYKKSRETEKGRAQLGLNSRGRYVKSVQGS